MTHSMTAFARVTAQENWGSVTLEIRSVNHRYLEINLPLPESLRSLETTLREKIKQLLQRGKVDCYVRFQLAAAVVNKLQINVPLVEQLIQANKAINQLLQQEQVLPSSMLLQWPGVLQAAETDFAVVNKAIVELLGTALQELVSVRAREGQQLAQFILERLSLLEQHIAVIHERLPAVLKDYRTKLLARLQDAKVNFDPNRLEQELVLIAQKTDVHEELDRISTHANEVRRNLQQTDAVGRNLDFLMQELNREANTLGAKCNDATISQIIVKIKVLIDQMREQIQNIE